MRLGVSSAHRVVAPSVFTRFQRPPREQGAVQSQAVSNLVGALTVPFTISLLTAFPSRLKNREQYILYLLVMRNTFHLTYDGKNYEYMRFSEGCEGCRRKFT